MDSRDLVHHGLAIKRLGTVEAVAELIGMPVEQVAVVLTDAVATRRAIEVNGAYTLTPLAKVALEGRYRLHYSSLRADPGFAAAFEQFERLNHSLKHTITQWQTVEVGGVRMANDHSDESYDAAIIDRLGAIHEEVDRILTSLSRRLLRLRVYADKLLFALEAAERGDPQWVSDVRRPSYHTVWFEMHEDLLRIMGRVREE
jgi:hypothetical protein